MNLLKLLHKSTTALVLLGIVSGMFFSALSAQAQAQETSAEELAKRYPQAVEYTIRRKGKKVGTHTVAFSNIDNGLRVDVESKITVTILKVPVFKFRYTAFEQWQNGALINVEAKTNSGGDITNASFTPDASDAIAFSSNHWNVNVLGASKIFNTLTGNISDVSIDLVGNETLEENNLAVSAKRYRYTGDIQADVWYDQNNRWVKLQFKGEDGSVISYTANPLNLAP